MALPLSTNVYYQLLSGAVFVGDRSLATGTLDGSKGLTFLGDTSELTLQPNQEFVEHIEHQTGQGHKDAKVPRTTTLKGNLTIDNTGIHNFQEFLRAKVTIVPDSTVTDEPYFAPAEGDSFAIGSWFIVSLASITNADGTITYQPGVDYIQNGRMIYIPNGSAMAQTAIAVNYVSGYAIESSLFGKRFQELYLFFQGSNAINGDKITIELFKVSFDPAKLGNLLGDDILQMSLGFDALYEPLQNNDSALGGFGNINFPFKGFELSADKEWIREGETFTITFVTSDPGSYGYTITGVDSADIGGEPLTGTFNGASATLTFTKTTKTLADFELTLDNNQASIIVKSIAEAHGDNIYCSQDMALLFEGVLSGNGIYCSQDVSGLFGDPLTGTGVYCSQDLVPLTT